MSKFIQLNSITQKDIIEWTGQALDFMKHSTVFQPAVKVEIVSNHQVAMPNYLHAIVQIARNNEWTEPSTNTDNSEEISVEETVDIPVAIDANGMPVNAYDLAYYRPFNDFDGEAFTIGGLHIKKYQYTPVRLANHSFFNTVVCKENGFEDIYKTCTDEYTIIENLLRFSFESGQIMISYLKQKLDENGFPMIPDEPSAIQAIESYIRMKVFQEEFDSNREGSERKYLKAESDWQWYCRQAKNEDMLPQTVDEMQNIMDWKNHLIPKKHRYYGFFGALSHPEHLNF